MEFNDDNYQNQAFQQLDLRRQQVTADFDGCTFSKCDFSDCDLSGSEFADCNFVGCNLSITKIANCVFRTVVFEESKLVGVDFTKCPTVFFSLAFKGCKISTCNFSVMPMNGASFADCTVADCRFNETDLRKAVFVDSDLTGTLFHMARLEGADFRLARNYFIDPRVNKIKGASFSLPEALSLLRSFDIDLRS